MFGRNLRLPQLKVALLHCYIVTLLHCYVFDFQSAQVCGDAPVVELRSYMITFNVFENDF